MGGGMIMGLVEGRDFVLAVNTAYVGCSGTGKGCIAGTKSILLAVPVETQIVTGRRMIKTSWTLNGIDPAEAILKFEGDVTDLEDFLRSIPAEISGSVLYDLSLVRRLRVRTGFLSRGIYVSENDSGPGWKGFSLNKQQSGKFREFYTGHPASVS